MDSARTTCGCSILIVTLDSYSSCTGGCMLFATAVVVELQLAVLHKSVRYNHQSGISHVLQQLHGCMGKCMHVFYVRYSNTDIWCTSQSEVFHVQQLPVTLPLLLSTSLLHADDPICCRKGTTIQHRPPPRYPSTPLRAS